MIQINTEREQRFIDMAATLADDFAQRAARHDEEASFPHENYARLRESGYTNLTIPEKFGGLGASMLERLKTQERLAMGCGPTALAINMHFNILGALDLFFAEATWEDAPQGETIISFFISPRDTPGLAFKDDWNTMGMRATESRSSEFKDAFVPEASVVLQRGVSKS
ncbi:acyl-CoA/acyl-ACP dehydrogenase [Candidatus Sumerlaeota bacterium]|nr:acyl-CoA/acyl-ACP dehydrogenase [Candidatus Sumerlaeota bacterium]